LPESERHRARLGNDNNVEPPYTPFHPSRLNRIEAQCFALRYFTLAGSEHRDLAT
jgi:hypothetical protein